MISKKIICPKCKSENTKNLQPKLYKLKLTFIYIRWTDRKMNCSNEESVLDKILNKRTNLK